MGRQLRVQRPPIRNISDLCDRCLNIWYNLSPSIYQGLVTSMRRWVEAVMYAEGRGRSFLHRSLRLHLNINGAHRPHVWKFTGNWFKMDPEEVFSASVWTGRKI
ncbi:transposase domain containing protein [Trichonephila clavipes]|nr:transposase domain containing protein [Trichonephila clavipes]